MNLTDITVVLDRSGSMATIAEDVVGGLNTFIAGQQQVEGEARFSLVQFDDGYDVVHFNVPMRDVPLLTPRDFVPRGTTALLDAIGRTIVGLDARLAALPAEQRPSRIIVVVQTDGHENASREFTRAQVFELIRQREQAGAATSGAPVWEFVYLAANQDAIHAGGDIGFMAAKSVDFDAEGGSVRDMHAVLSRKIARARVESVDLQYTPDERAQTRRKPTG